VSPFKLHYWNKLTFFTLVVKQKLPGVYVQPSYQSALMWFGVIFIWHGLYQDGVFKFTVYIPDNYPDGECPRLVFDIPVFHPLVDPESVKLDVKRAFAKWRRNHNHIWQVLMYAWRIFYKIDTNSPLNPEVLYEKDVKLFKSKVVESVRLCNIYLIKRKCWRKKKKKKAEEQSKGLHPSHGKSSKNTCCCFFLSFVK
uniref:UBC core domain-containing protein n=1 Tax=Leptobrachium leishanense TaxID=445787 RepID=A0A8C5MXE3_9ANUR